MKLLGKWQKVNEMVLGMCKIGLIFRIRLDILILIDLNVSLDEL